MVAHPAAERQAVAGGAAAAADRQHGWLVGEAVVQREHARVGVRLEQADVHQFAVGDIHLGGFFAAAIGAGAGHAEQQGEETGQGSFAHRTIPRKDIGGL